MAHIDFRAPQAAAAFARRASMNKYIVSIFALIDSSGFLLYLFNLDFTVFYAATLGAKLVLMIFYKRTTATDILYAQGVLCLIIIGGIANSLVQSEWNPNDMQGFGFVAHMICTCWVVDYNNFRRYFSGCANVILICGLLFLAMYYTGRIPEDVNGRYTFFGAHPNLGGEIFTAGVFASLIGQDLKRNAVQAVVLAAAVMVLQSRAALLTIMVMCIMKYLDVFDFRRGVFYIISVVGATCIAIAVAAFFVDFNSIFLVNDQYRGADTGFVGRTELWQYGWDAFISAPIFGNGYGFYYDNEVGGAHNFFIYLLVLFGMFGVLLLAMYIFLGYVLYKNNPRVGRVLLGFALLCIFNDRLFDLNPFPFFLHVTLLTVPRIGVYLGARGNARIQTAKY
jgi:O-antigen ligase